MINKINNRGRIKSVPFFCVNLSLFLAVPLILAMPPTQPGCISVIGRLLTFVRILSLTCICCVWAGAVQAQNEDAGGAPTAVSPDELPLLDAELALNLARKWIAEGQPQQAFELLRRVMQAAKAEGDIDTTNIRFLAAQALLKMGRPAHAAVILGQLAAEQPELNRVRLDFASTLFTLGHDEQAETIFRELRRKDDLPAQVRRNVEGFLERIRARQRFQVNFDFGFWRDNNVNHAPEQESVQVRYSATGIRTGRTGGEGLGGAYRPESALASHSRAGRTRLLRDPCGRCPQHGHQRRRHNRTWLNLSSGPRWRYAMNLAGQRRPGMLRADIGGERRWRGGDNYAVSGWARLGLDQTLNRNWSAGASARVWKRIMTNWIRNLTVRGNPWN